MTLPRFCSVLIVAMGAFVFLLNLYPPNALSFDGTDD